MLTPTLRSLFEHAAGDPAFRAQLLANPALAEGLTREQIEKLLGEMALLNGELTDEMLEIVAGARSGVSTAFKGGDVPSACGTTVG